MKRGRSQQHKATSRKRKQEQMGIDNANKNRWIDNGGIDRLPDDALINIVSHMSLKEAAGASVLAHRWRYLWRFSHGTLRFDQWDTSTRNVMKREKFKSWVSTVLELHQGRYIEGMVISFEAGPEECWPMYREVDSWVDFAIQKEVQMFELNLCLDDRYIFPFVMFKSHSHGVSSSFCHLRTFRLAHVDIADTVVHYFLASCPNLEELCIQFSYSPLKLRVVDPPSLRVLEISRCPRIWSLEISAVNLVSLTYGGGKNSLLLKKVPNLRELTISDDVCVSFVLQPKEHSSYSVQLEKLVLDFRKMNYDSPVVAPPDLPQLCSLKRLEVQVFTVVGRTLLFFTSLIKASPHLCEFRIELGYSVYSASLGRPTFAGIISEVGTFVHRNLKVVEMGGYIGCRCAEELVLASIRTCPSIERVAIDTKSDYYDDPQLDSYIAFRRRMEIAYGSWRGTGATTRNEAKKLAKRFASNIPKRINFIVT